MEDRIISFSVKPTDLEGTEEIKMLKDYSKTSGIKFSYLVIEAIKAKNVELNLKKDSK